MALIHWEDVIQASIYSSAEADGRVIFFSLLFFLLRAPQFQHIEYEWGGSTPTTTWKTVYFTIHKVR